MNKNCSIIIAFIFLVVFLVKIDRINNIAKADCWGDYNVCYENASGDSEEKACYATYELCYANESADTSSEADKTCGANAYLFNGDCYCESGYSENANYDCELIDLNNQQCEIDKDCDVLVGSGYKCVDGDCELDSIIPGKECETDDDCVRNYGEGYACSGYVQKTCEFKSTPGLSTCDTCMLTNSQQDCIKKKECAGAVTTKNTTINNTFVPADSTITPGGAVYDPSGNMILPAGSIDTSALTSGSTNSGSLMFCANGIIGTTCSGGGGSPLSIGAIGGGSYNAGLPSLGYSPGSVAGLPGQACGPGFTPIGGVCFPTTTGLSAAPISAILANIFSWLMGLFTTLAIIAFVISGIQYLISAGDTDMIERAKRNALYALLGVIIGLSGFIIVQAIAAALSGQSYFF